MYFHPKLAWPLATYDAITKLSQNLREGWTKSYLKRQVLMFYPPEKNSEHPPPPLPLVRQGLTRD